MNKPDIEDDPTDDEDFFSVEADEMMIPTDDPQIQHLQ